jgi:CRP-like cAMP-binding protein
MPITPAVPVPVPASLLETLLRMAPLDVLLFDAALVCRYAVLGEGTLFGRTADQFLGQPVDAIFPPARDDLRTAMELAAGGSDASYQYPAYRYTYADTSGTTETAFCWSVRVEPVVLHDYRGQEEFRGVLVTLADVLDLTDEVDRLRQERDALQREVDRLRQERTATRATWPLDDDAPPVVRTVPIARGTPARANRLLAALPPEGERRLLPDLERVALAAHDVLHEPGASITHVYFPVDCVVSLMAVTPDGPATEAATVCNEGVVGLPIFPGGGRAVGRAICQVSGDAIRLSTPAFRAALAEDEAFAWLVQRYTQRLLEQVMRTAACHRLHRVDQRAACWLLQIQDCIGADQFPLTQEVLATMLSVQRPTVTLVAGLLRRAGALDYRRGHVTVVDRAALEAVACSCYRSIRDRLTETTP